jgi:molybdate transport system regulatory protein
MNKLSAVITSITSNDSLSFLELNARGIELAMLLFDPNPEFVTGSKVFLLFKETEVALGVNCCGETSFSNQFPATITAINRGEILSYIHLASIAGELASVITTKSVARLNLQEGCEVTAIIKASQISMEACHED